MTWCKSILFFLSKKIAAKNFLPTVILMSIFLLPHGFGYRFPIGHLDAPRLTLLCVVIFWFVVVSREVLKSKSLALLPGMPLVFFQVCLILLSAIFSTNSFASLVLAVQMCTLWFVFPYCFFDTFKETMREDYINRTLILITIVLCLFASLEFFSQSYIVHPTFRTSFVNEPSFHFFMSTISRSGSILAQGPFTWNHTLSGVCAAMAGTLIYVTDKYQNRWGFVFSLVYVMLLMSTGVRAGYFGVLLALICYSVFQNKYNYLSFFIVASFAVNLLYKFYVGNDAPVFFTYDIDVKWLDETPAKMNNFRDFLDYSDECPAFVPCSEIVKWLMHFGPIGIKLVGFVSNFMNWEDWWFLGYGFGSFQRPDAIASTALQYDDPGLIQLVFLEAGLIAGFLLVFILTRAVILSFRHESLRNFSLSIASWSLFAVSSWDVWPLLLIMLYVFLIFTHHHESQITIEGTRHNPR